MSYKVLILDDALTSTSSPKEEKKFLKKIKDILSKTPFPHLHNKITPLKGVKEMYRLRVGDLRVFFTVKDKTVKVLKVKNRNICYTQSGKRKTPV